MNFKKILYDLIEKEIEGIDWHKGKPISKTRRKKLKKYTIIFLIFFLIFLTFSLAEAAFNIVNLCLIIFYFFILYRNTYADIIIKIAKKNPHKPIKAIIEEEML